MQLSARLQVPLPPVRLRFLCTLLSHHQDLTLKPIQDLLQQEHLDAATQQQPWGSAAQLCLRVWPVVQPGKGRCLQLLLQLLEQCISSGLADLSRHEQQEDGLSSVHNLQQTVQGAIAAVAASQQAAPTFDCRPLVESVLGQQLGALACATDPADPAQISHALTALDQPAALPAEQHAAILQQLHQVVTAANANSLAAALELWQGLLPPPAAAAHGQRASLQLGAEAVSAVLVCRLMSACEDDEGDMLQQWGEAVPWLCKLSPSALAGVVQHLALDGHSGASSSLGLECLPTGKLLPSVQLLILEVGNSQLCACHCTAQ